MKIEMIKHSGGLLIPASDFELERLNKFKTDGQYTIEIKKSRNPAFHRKVFAFFNFCFEYWKGDNEFQSESKQFDVFRENLMCFAGFYESFYNIKGEVRVEAKSISFSSMEQEEFEECYLSLINAAIKHVFQGANSDIENKLLAFF